MSERSRPPRRVDSGRGRAHERLPGRPGATPAGGRVSRPLKGGGVRASTASRQAGATRPGIPLAQARVVLLNKPFGLLSQFRAEGRWRGLSELGLPPSVYAAGRLDADSEGLLVLTDSGALNAALTQPGAGTVKQYLAQVEGRVSAAALDQLCEGVRLNDGPARALTATAVPDPERLLPGGLWPREPPIRVRQSVPTDWLLLTLSEGRNRIVRRLSAAVGLPTLRLIRLAVGPFSLCGPGSCLKPGEFQVLPSGAWSHGPSPVEPPEDAAGAGPD